jgi:NADH-quinone oxidoreductase subunit L
VQTPQTVVGRYVTGHKTAEAPAAAPLMAEAEQPAAPPHAMTDAHEAAPAVAAGHSEAMAEGPVFTDERQAELAHGAHAAHYTAIIISSIMVVIGISLALIVYAFRIIDPEKTSRAIRPLYLFSFNKWYWDEMYDATVIRFSMVISKMLAWFDAKIVDGIVNGVAIMTRNFAFANGSFDKYIVDGLVNFTAFFVNTTGAVLRKLQTGKVQTYIVLALFAVLGYFVYYFTKLIY